MNVARAGDRVIAPFPGGATAEVGRGARARVPRAAASAGLRGVEALEVVRAGDPVPLTDPGARRLEDWTWRPASTRGGRVVLRVRGRERVSRRDRCGSVAR